jgi:hypothetical protein
MILIVTRNNAVPSRLLADNTNMIDAHDSGPDDAASLPFARVPRRQRIGGAY